MVLIVTFFMKLIMNCNTTAFDNSTEMKFNFFFSEMKRNLELLQSTSP